ncbi:winged helix-turn-helix transcriptional regulator [Herbidospora galbida]|uniref:Winged helix-turn-helix transcriptional regulator n=1 Tax=Herbidospora galbida TaxID=2575442 RepID=A0A4U3MSY3_9ACTN|nr:metalloregulator ArsR/SmtB family transcription factor [Herbidospora galbida]TKK91647.1 winged helix-turn-helix transcriptional regulator [Herbidospora galbida]
MSKQTSCCAPLAREPIGKDDAAELAKVLKAVADPVRLRLLSLIAARDEDTCVCDLLPEFDLSQPTISHHLKILREAGLIESERRGTWVYSWVIPQALDRLSALFTTAPAETGAR